jgi:hypothetical protein
MKYTLYNPATGQIVKLIETIDQQILLDNLQNCNHIKGHYDSKNYYIEHDQIKQLPPCPDTNLTCYDFDWDTKTWLINLELFQTNIRITRNQLLADIDRVNPIWYASLDQSQQEELAV